MNERQIERREDEIWRNHDLLSECISDGLGTDPLAAECLASLLIDLRKKGMTCAAQFEDKLVLIVRERAERDLDERV